MMGVTSHLPILFFGGILEMLTKKEILIDGKMLEVVDLEQYLKNPEGYLNGYTAVDTGVSDYIFPVIPSTSSAPGIVVKKDALFLYPREPEGEDAEQYKRDKVIDYSKASTFKEYAQMHDMVRSIEKDILSSPDNIYVPSDDPDDSPAMKALKQAIVDKHIDLDKYEPRFGSNYNNDKRILNKNTISMPMLVRMCNALDIKATLTLEDQSSADGDVPNPMNTKITVELTSSNNGGDD